MKAVKVKLLVAREDGNFERVVFTSVPMERVHAAIDLLNGTTGATLAELVEKHGVTVAKMMYNTMYGKPKSPLETAIEESQKAKAETRFAPAADSSHWLSNSKAIQDELNNPLPYKDSDSMREHRTEDFTVAELFPNYEHTSICVECGVFVYPAHLETHTTWHNKTLP